MAGLVPAEGPILEQILDESYGIWNDGLSRAAYGRYWRAQTATAWGRTHLERYALVEGGGLLASGKLYAFDAVLAGRAIRVAGLGAIFTSPAHRGRGAARELVERLLTLAVDRGADVALLFSEIGAPYYERLGFAPIPTTDRVIRVREDARRGAPAMMVRAGEDRDVADVASSDASRAQAYRFHLTRDRALVQHAIVKARLAAGLGPAGARQVHFFVAEEGASAVAYIVLTVKGGAWTIEACGDRDPAGARLGAILQLLVAREPAERRPAIAGWLPDELSPPQLECVDRRPSRDVMMVRALGANADGVASLREADVCYWSADRF